MSLTPGRYDQRVTFQERTSSTNDFGEDVPTWSDVAEVWARVEPLRGREFFQAGQMQSSAEVRITVRWRAGLDEKMRIVWRGVPHEIVAPPIDVSGKQIDLEFMCASGLRDGR